MRRYHIEILIIRSDFNKTNSSKFKGTLNFVSNKYGVIFDWKITFDEVWIDLFTTKSWFKEKTTSFKRREALFNKLGLKQVERPSKSSNKLYKLNIEQIEQVNNYFNNRKEYNSTIKNILPILKGNNPGGEAKNPASGEMIIDTNSSIKNFVILFDDLVMKKKVSYNVAMIGAEDISFEHFCELNKELHEAFKFMQQAKSFRDFSNYLNNIKEYYRKFNIDDKEAERIAKKARSRFSKNVEENIKELPFGFTKSAQFQKCHIYEFHELRDKILEAIREQRSTKQFEEMIADPENFLPLPEEVHRKFDSDWFTYKTNGEIYALNEDGYNYVQKELRDVFKVIPEKFLTERRKQYLEYRNQNSIY